MPSLPCATDDHARRDGRRRATGRAARRAVEVPRVAGDAEDRVGRAEDAQLGHAGQPDDDRTGPAQPPHDLVVELVCGARVGPGLPMRIGSPLTGDVVLDRDRHAGQRQREPVGALVDRVRLAQRRLGTHHLERADAASRSAMRSRAASVAVRAVNSPRADGGGDVDCGDGPRCRWMHNRPYCRGGARMDP